MNTAKLLVSLEFPRTHGFRLVFLGMILLCITVVSSAQVPPITSSGLGTNVAVPVDIGSGVTKLDIMGGTRPGGGQNLFHSFGEFNVPENSIANFLNDSGLPTSNILSRVTGGNPSNIFGSIQTTGFAGANLFLLNPNGVIFGPNATLDVKGGFYASTADFIRLGQSDMFYANLNGEASVLTMAPPEAFGFLGATSPVISEGGNAAIHVKGLAVPLGESVSLVGRDAVSGGGFVPGVGITEGTVHNPGGGAKIVSVGGLQLPEIDQVLVGIDTLAIQGMDTQGQVLQGSVSLGEINFSQGANIDASGESGGTVRIVGGRLLLDASGISSNTLGQGEGSLNVEPGLGIDIQVSDELFLNNGSFLQTLVLSDALEDVGSGGISVQADHVEIADNSVIQSIVLPGSTGGTKSGDIHVEAKSLRLRDGGIIQSITEGLADSGDISLTVSNDVEILRDGLLRTISGGSGQAGKIDVTVNQGNLSIKNISGIFTLAFGPGHGGDVTVTLDHGDLSISELGTITSQTNGGGGDAGNINLVVREGNVHIDRGDIFSFIANDGEGGNIELSANDLELNKGSISVQTFSSKKAGSIDLSLTGSLDLREDSRIDVLARGMADAGQLTITADKDVSITGDSIISSATKSGGRGGDLGIAAENIFVNTGGNITAESTSTGNAGNINLIARDTILIDNSFVTTEAIEASGGNINLQAREMIRLNDSTISSSVQGNATTVGGNISLDPEFIILENSQILAKAVEGQGGNISLVATNAVLVDPLSVLDASSALGVSGSVDIQAPIQNLSGTIAPLPEETTPVTALYGVRCAAGQGGNFSTFVDSKAESLSPSPGTFLSSPLLPPSIQAMPNTFGRPQSPVVLTALVVSLVLGQGDPRTACP